MTPRIYRVILPVADVEEATRFYGTLLGTSGERVSAGRAYFDCGGVVLAVLDHRADGEDRDFPGPNPEILYLAEAELDAARRRAEEAGADPGEIERRPWGETSFYVRDPWGNALCFAAEGTEFTGARFIR